MQCTLLLFLALSAPSASPPRIIPLRVSHAKQMIHEWVDRAKANDDMERANILSRSAHSYEKVTTSGDSALSELGSIGVTIDDTITAAALMKKIDANTLSVLNVEANDLFSGTLLIQVFVRHNITLSDQIDTRWKIAVQYFTASSVDASS
jgi:hypothetical protein